ncbi:MAG: hypothetical protein SNJ74_04170 [Fimbriimonadaceae bacterium]
MLETTLFVASLGLAASVPFAVMDSDRPDSSRRLSADELAQTVGAGFGRCPETANACNNTSGCHPLNPRKFVEWHGLTRCTWGLEGCQNSGTGRCKTEYTVLPVCQWHTCILPGNDVMESKCP